MNNGPAAVHIPRGRTSLKRLVALVTALATALGLAATASAAVSVSQGTNIQLPYSTYYQVVTPYNCGGVSLSDPRPVLLKFGWFDQTTSQVATFFQNEHGTYTLSGPGGSVTETWSETSGSPAVGTYVTWSPIAAGSIINQGGAIMRGYDSFYYGILSFDTPGDYTFNMAWTIDKNLYDGGGVFKAGTYHYSCTVAVTS